MATGPDCVARFEQEALFVASPALIARRLREKAPDLWPASPKGGGAKAPQVQPHHLTAFILAQAAATPMDAGEPVTALRELAMSQRQELEQKAPAGDRGPRVPPEFLTPMQDRDRLGPTLDTMIDRLADPTRRTAALKTMDNLRWVMTLCADPPRAALSWQIGRTLWVEHFGPQVPNNRAHRLITIPYKVFAVAGELWQDSVARRDQDAATFIAKVAQPEFRTAYRTY